MGYLWCLFSLFFSSCANVVVFFTDGNTQKRGVNGLFKNKKNPQAFVNAKIGKEKTNRTTPKFALVAKGR